jgi:hypothetical protein
MTIIKIAELVDNLKEIRLAIRYIIMGAAILQHLPGIQVPNNESTFHVPIYIQYMQGSPGTGFW